MIAKMGYPALAMVHAENIDIVLRLREKLEKEGRQDGQVWNESRPNYVEAECMHRAIFLAKVAECPLFIVHNTIGEAPEILAKAKAEGVDLKAEICPQYLTHNSEEPAPVLLENPTFAVVNPPLRGKCDNEMLWKGIKDGVIDTVGSDNAPATREQKGWDMWNSYMGTGSNTQMILPVMLSEGVNKNRVSLERVVEVCCQNPAKIFGLYHKKGVIRIGSDADLVIVDMDKKVKFANEMSAGLGGWTIYKDWEFTGWPVLTMLRGKVIMEDGKIVAELEYGRYISRGQK
ncbi:dihydroorotase family protein [Chloroflexota bacterium]